MGERIEIVGTGGQSIFLLIGLIQLCDSIAGAEYGEWFDVNCSENPDSSKASQNFILGERNLRLCIMYLIKRNVADFMNVASVEIVFWISR